jgi:hypothetical protein
LSRIRYVQHIGENGVRLFHAASALGVVGHRREARRFSLWTRAHSDGVKIRTPAGMDIQAERAKWNE